jgi:hypothetical protein
VEGSGRGLIFKVISQNLLEELKKITKNLSQDSLYPGRDLNLVPPKYEAGTYFWNDLSSSCRFTQFKLIIEPIIIGLIIIVIATTPLAVMRTGHIGYGLSFYMKTDTQPASETLSSRQEQDPEELFQW